MMSVLPTGPRNVHIQQSQGADTNIMKFYITQNSTTHGARYEKFKPRLGQHKGTGYLSNLRPGVYYNRRLDDVDNPAMRRICDGNYRSVTQLDFQPFRDASGFEVFPFSVKQTPTGFARPESFTNPTDSQAKSVFIDTRAASAPTNFLPRHKPLLHHLQPKDPVEIENYGYGPRYMKTETKEKFKGQPWNSVDPSTKEIGPQTLTGFTNCGDQDPVTLTPHIAHENLKPGWYTHRPTGVSIMKTSFVPKDCPRGNEPLPGGVSHYRSTGFTREEVKPKYVNVKAPDAYDNLSNSPTLKADRIRKQDPAEFLNMQFPHNRTSVQQEFFKGQQWPAPTEIDKLNLTKVGCLERTGYAKNNHLFVPATEDKMTFITHYMTRFGSDPTPSGVDKATLLRRGIQRPRSNGFTKSSTSNAYGDELSSSEVMRTTEPYVGRSLRTRNIFYDDHTYDSKIHTELVA